MNDSNLLQSLGQVSNESAAEVFRLHLRGLVRQMITDVMAEEVTHLCGAKHQPNDEVVYRAGSTPGRLIYEVFDEQREQYFVYREVSTRQIWPFESTSIRNGASSRRERMTLASGH